MNLAQVSLETISDTELRAWEKYAAGCIDGEVYALPSWARAVSRAYGLKVHVLLAFHKSGRRAEGCGFDGSRAITEDALFHESDELVGTLGLVRVRHWLFGDSLVSMPFCDSGGGIVGDGRVGLSLAAQACEVAEKLGTPILEVRRQNPIVNIDGTDDRRAVVELADDRLEAVCNWRLDSLGLDDKVRMVLSLPESAEDLMRSFKSKLRSQIQKPMKDGLRIRRGGLELVEEFYRVFVENMRDLGSPVHSRHFVEAVVSEYGDAARVFVVELKGVAIAGSVTLGFGRVLSNPWASSLRRYSQLAPNMLLYWSMLEYACENGYQQFDFGRSTVGEGTYRFKEQWGARPQPLYWYRFTRGDAKPRALDRDSGGMSRAVEIWKRLPLPVTRVLGPRIRRYISL